MNNVNAHLIVNRNFDILNHWTTVYGCWVFYFLHLRGMQSMVCCIDSTYCIMIKVMIQMQIELFKCRLCNSNCECNSSAVNESQDLKSCASKPFL